MNKYFKKFGIMFVMLLVLIGIGIIQHGTTANAATVGDALVNVQDGWRRYQVEDNPYLILNGFIQAYSGNSESNGHEIIYSQDVGTASFSFYGSKLLLRGYLGYNVSFKVSIDGKDETTNIKPIRDGYGMTYEKDNLDLRNHTVEITNVSGRTYFDSIDIDKDGYLIDPNESISLDKSSMDLNVGDSQQLTATTTPAGAQVTWTSSDSSIATVDSNGNVTGVKEGQATITATTADGLTATCTVTVSKEDESISLNKSTTYLTTGDSETLIATTTPSAVNVTWSSSDTSVATVDSTGKVTAISAGTATITATTTDGSNLSASCAVNVTPKDTTTPTYPTGDANLYIELVDGQIKQYTVSSDEISKFTEWYENRDNDHSLPATYKFTKGSYTDYVVQSQIDWFEVR